MTFPLTPIIDNATRSDENPLNNALWHPTLSMYPGVTGRMRIVSNSIRGVSGDNAQAFTASARGSDQEIGMLVTDITDWDMVECFIRSDKLETAAYTSYSCAFFSDGSFELKRSINAVETTIDSGDVGTPSSGDGFAVQAIGDAIKGYYFDGATWTEVASATDANLRSGGHMGIYAGCVSGNFATSGLRIGTVWGGDIPQQKIMRRGALMAA